MFTGLFQHPIIRRTFTSHVLLILAAEKMCGSREKPCNSSPEIHNLRSSPFGSAAEEAYAHQVGVGACHPPLTSYRILAKPPETGGRLASPR